MKITTDQRVMLCAVLIQLLALIHEYTNGGKEMLGVGMASGIVFIVFLFTERKP